MSVGRGTVAAFFGWEGNRSSGVVLHAPQTLWYINVRAQR